MRRTKMCIRDRVNGEGEILWGKTIDESFAIIEDNRPYYMEMYTGKTVEDDMDYFKRLHECVITECSRQLHDAQLDTCLLYTSFGGWARSR